MYYRITPSRTLRTNALHTARFVAHGLDYFSVFCACASGPAGLVSTGFENEFVRRALCCGAPLPAGTKWFVGGSTAALRFCALLTRILTGQDTTERLKELYCDMTYCIGDTATELRPMLCELYHLCAPPPLLRSMVGHGNLHLAIMVAHLPDCDGSCPDWRLALAFLWIFVQNLVCGTRSRRLTRLCFYTGRDLPVFAAGNPDIRFVPLTEHNFYQVLKATTCIPFLAERCTAIQGVGAAGLFFDGALTDYMFNLHIAQCPALLLNDYPDATVKRTLFDVGLPFRYTPASCFHNCTMIQPTRHFVNSLPNKAVPNVLDWFNPKFIADPSLRRLAWRKAYTLSTQFWPRLHNSGGS